MKAVYWIGLLLETVAVRGEEQVKAQYSWNDSGQRSAAKGGTVVQDGQRTVLKITNSSTNVLNAHLLTIENPPVKKTVYAIRGEVRYDSVAGVGYLEMWNYFRSPDGMAGPQYFSRTLAPSGELGRISGTSGWRRFTLPFNRQGASGSPTKLELNLVLPSSGTVEIGPLTLVDVGESFAALSLNGQWWSERTVGIMGGIVGTVIGTLSGVVGWLASKGKARTFVLATVKFFLALGLASLAAGLVIIFLGQPFAIWFIFILVGVILLSIYPAQLKQYQKRYEELELRKMAAADSADNGLAKNI